MTFFTEHPAAAVFVLVKRQFGCRQGPRLETTAQSAPHGYTGSHTEALNDMAPGWRCSRKHGSKLHCSQAASAGVASASAVTQAVF